ncbi:hypothetical protein PIROE2DRAFT_13901 [Piromyces sp. E2]|nr:hypothetical protein PIROE2DRAFT_13901 [Piromyces sp. E2]|eukprot:OUM60355.1 hypothetical protein PIROE2DRAFT_13901 [Piromyces sp. E2]
MKGLYFYLFIGLIVNFILITINAKNISLDTANEKNSTVTLENKNENESNETNKVVDFVIDQIHQLIVDNVDTYKKPEILEKMEKEDSFRKRDQAIEYLLDYGDSSLVYPISTFHNITVLYAYLSSDVVETVKSLPHVKYCAEEKYYESASDPTIDFIKENTHWKNVGVTNDAPLYLSVVSQGRFDESVNGKYDNNYYYPSTAGEGVDIFIFDNGFDFTHDEFSNTDERTVKCIFRVKDGKLYKPLNEKICYHEEKRSHGTMVSTTAGGRISGAAKKANVYGVVFDEFNMANKAASLQYNKDNLFGPNKAIFNFSHGKSMEYDPNKIIDYDREYELINALTEEGAIFFASAGNDSELEYTVDDGSNRGKGVDIYAPYSVSINYNDEKGVEMSDKVIKGTSFSSPLVAGIVATILSENKNINFNKERMLAYLNEIGFHDIIEGVPEGAPNLFINNGNHMVYDENGNVKWDYPVDDQQIEKIVNDNEPYVWRKWNGLFPSNVISTINSDGKTLLVGRIAYKNGIHCGYVDLKSKK